MLRTCKCSNPDYIYRCRWQRPYNHKCKHQWFNTAGSGYNHSREERWFNVAGADMHKFGERSAMHCVKTSCVIIFSTHINYIKWRTINACNIYIHLLASNQLVELRAHSCKCAQRSNINCRCPRAPVLIRICVAVATQPPPRCAAKRMTIPWPNDSAAGESTEQIL